MSKSKKNLFAIRTGRTGTTVVRTWAEATKLVTHFKGADHKGVATFAEALEFCGIVAHGTQAALIAETLGFDHKYIAPVVVLENEILTIAANPDGSKTVTLASGITARVSPEVEAVCVHCGDLTWIAEEDTWTKGDTVVGTCSDCFGKELDAADAATDAAEEAPMTIADIKARQKVVVVQLHLHKGLGQMDEVARLATEFNALTKQKMELEKANRPVREIQVRPVAQRKNHVLDFYVNYYDKKDRAKNAR